jgi:hypothetical protein
VIKFKSTIVGKAAAFPEQSFCHGRKPHSPGRILRPRYRDNNCSVE